MQHDLVCTVRSLIDYTGTGQSVEQGSGQQVSEGLGEMRGRKRRERLVRKQRVGVMTV